jgi:Na+-driven multidrug efflux pump
MVVNAAMLFFAVAIVGISAVSGTGATRVALNIEIAAIAIYMIHNYITTFVFRTTVEVVWFSEVIYWLFTAIACYWYIRSGKWKKIVV